MKAVRYVGNNKRLPADYLNCLAPTSGYTIVDSLRDGGNVTIRAKLDGKYVKLRTDAVTRDFLDLATLVYIVDEISERQAAGDHWTRNFEVFAPVAHPAIWAKHQAALSKLLRTLAGDNYTFTWSERPKLGDFGNHRLGIPSGYDVVCLFSGGVDSFLGAHRLLTSGKRVLLVGHQADGTAASAQSELAQLLQQRFPGKARMIQFRVARSKASKPRFQLPENCEDTHRPRSLLFLALAIAVAKNAKIKTVLIPENGLIALNPPLGKSRLGSLTTRTAHPKYLTELEDFLHASRIFEGEIKNPFIFESKTDMLLGIDSSLETAVTRSVSCARPSRYKNLGVRHCGYCMPCIYRRAAMLNRGLDRKTDYAFDVLGDLASIEASKQMDLRALVKFAQVFLRSNSTKRSLLVLAHGHFSPAAGERFGDSKTKNYDPWVEMIERWAYDFIGKLKERSSKSSRKIIGL